MAHASMLERKKLLNEYIASGLKRKVFCDKHKLKLSTLNYWMREQKQDEAISFVEVQEKQSRLVVIRLPSGIAIESNEYPSIVYLKELSEIIYR